MVYDFDIPYPILPLPTEPVVFWVSWFPSDTVTVPSDTGGGCVLVAIISLSAIVPRVELDGRFLAIGAATFPVFPMDTVPPTMPKAAKPADWIIYKYV